MYRNITGAILAGGRNRRFGGILKSKLQVKGIPVISRIIGVFAELFDEIIIVTNTPEEYQAFTGCKIICDRYVNIGPLGGIHAALGASSREAVFVMAGDMPFPDKQIIMRTIDRFIEKNAEITLPSLNSRVEPLHAVYKVQVFKKIEQHIAVSNNYSVRDFINSLCSEIIILENCIGNLAAMANMNSPSDLRLLNTWSSE